MCYQDSLKYLIFAIVLLPKLTESVNCDDYKTNTSMQGPPIMTELKNNQTKFIMKYTGSFVILRCCTSGNPSPTVIWYKNESKIEFSKSKLKLVSNNQSLWIPSIKTADSGIYSCRSTNKFGSVSRRFKVLVKSFLELQKPVVILKPNSWSAVVGSNVTLTCIVKKSANKPQILWHLNSTSTRPLQRYTGRHFVSLKEMDEEQTWRSNLTITNVTMADGGDYICVARNGFSSKNVAQDNGVLTVEEPPKIKISSSIPGQETSAWKEQGPVVFTTIAVLISAALVIGLIWWYKKRHSRTPGIDNNYPIESEFHRLVNGNNGMVPCEMPSLNIPLVQNYDSDFDVFISYSNQDRDFVKSILFDELSTTHSVCIDFKDFEAGLYIGDNICNSIFRSKKTLLVVSKNFLSGVWTHLEMQIAQGRLDQGHDVLIPVIIEDIPFDDLPKTLQYYRQTKTYLEYFNEDVRPHFWDRLRSTLGPSLQEYQNQTAPEDDSLASNQV